MAVLDLKINMPTVYGSSYEDIGKTVAMKYPGQETTKLKWAWAHYSQYRKFSIEQFKALQVTQAEIVDIACMNEAPNNLKIGFQNTYSQAILPKGRFLVSSMSMIPRGGMIGEGSFVYAGNGGDQGQVATQFDMLDGTGAQAWIDQGTERRMFQTPNADYVGNLGYNEGLTIAGVRLEGPRHKGYGITRVGWYLKKLGSTSWINQIQANGFAKGFVVVDGVPAVMGTIRAFECDAASLSGEGTWGADITILKLEVDGSGRAFQLVKGADGTAAGGTWKVGVKIEDGVTAGIAAPGTFCYFEGQYCVDLFVNTSFANGVKPQHLFVVNPTIGKDAAGNEQLQSSLLTVQGKGYGYGKLLKNNVTGMEWDGPGDYAAYRFEHYSKGDVLATNCPTLKATGGGSTGGGATPATPKLTLSNVTATSSTKTGGPLTGVTKIVYTGFKAPSVAFGWLTDGGWINVGDVNSTGSFSQAKVAANTLTTFTMIFSSPQNLTNAVGTVNGTLPFTCTKIEYF